MKNGDNKLFRSNWLWGQTEINMWETGNIRDIKVFEQKFVHDKYLS